MPKGTKAIGSRTKKNKLTEDGRYDPTPGGMEWGTDKGDNYYRSLTPGQTPKNRKAPIKPLPIKARKPEDEKAAVKEGVIGGAVGATIGANIGGVGGAIKGAKIGSAVGDAAAVGAAAYGAYKVGKGVVKTGKKVGNVGKRIKNKLSGKKKIEEDLDLSHIEDKQADHSKHQYPINNEIETFDTGDKDHWLTGKDGEWYIEQDDVKELDKEAENFTFDKALDMGLYDDERTSRR